MAVNGEAIYCTRPWKVFGEGPTRARGGYFAQGKVSYTPEDFRFTKKDDALYAICMALPESGQVTIRSLAQGSGAGRVNSVKLLGYDGRICRRRSPARSPGHSRSSSPSTTPLSSGAGGKAPRAAGSLIDPYAHPPGSRRFAVQSGFTTLARSRQDGLSSPRCKAPAYQASNLTRAEPGPTGRAGPNPPGRLPVHYPFTGRRLAAR